MFVVRTILPHAIRHRLALSAFTLVELLVVVAIIGILAALLMPAIKSALESGREAACAVNLRMIGNGVALIAADEEGRLPGSGTRPDTGFSASWVEVMNTWVFDAPSFAATGPLQRTGDKPNKRQMYCPSIRPWPGRTAQGNAMRAYGMNANYRDPNYQTSPTQTNKMPPISSYRGVQNFTPGRKIISFPHPSSTVLVSEMEQARDTVDGTSAITFAENSTNPPWVSTDGNWAFRHKFKSHVLFMDGHVETCTVESAKDLNRREIVNGQPTYPHFDPDL